MKLRLDMKTVGLRELKNRLSEDVREVRPASRLVTDRGEMSRSSSHQDRRRTDEVLPPGWSTCERGRLTLGADNEGAAYPRLSRLLKRDRAAEFSTMSVAVGEHLCGRAPCWRGCSAKTLRRVCESS